MKAILYSVFSVILFFAASANFASSQPIDNKDIALPASMRREISLRAASATSIIKQTLADSSLYRRLAYMCDTYGNRLSGSLALERAIDWTVETMKTDGFDTVYTENVSVPRWVRGEESAELIAPYHKRISMLGLGGSVAGPQEGIEAEVMVVKSFEELKSRASQAKGKIILFNVPFTEYGATVQYRVNGAIEAARAGAAASLVRSVGPFSVYTPHTGAMHYDANAPQIPHAAISLEDAELLQRMQDRGQKPRLLLKMSCQTMPDAQSRNIIAEIRGSDSPDEVVVFGGHIDSWDVGQGAMDDGGGCFAAWRALSAIKQLNLRPRRTLRLVFWTNEENGLRGGTTYAENRKNNISNHILAIESDAGTFAPQGFEVEGSDSARAIIKEICSLLDVIGATKADKGGAGADVSPLTNAGVPGCGLKTDGTKYFWYHHTNADTIDKLDSDELNRCAAAIGVLAFVAADLPFKIPRK